jgi:hypothetical protein
LIKVVQAGGDPYQAMVDQYEFEQYESDRPLTPYQSKFTNVAPQDAGPRGNDNSSPGFQPPQQAAGAASAEDFDMNYLVDGGFLGTYHVNDYAEPNPDAAVMTEEEMDVLFQGYY